MKFYLNPGCVGNLYRNITGLFVVVQCTKNKRLSRIHSASKERKSSEFSR